ncbi:MAG: hypothetical protein IJZ88_02860 [Clostridia bacterium]|nr:hypothetical protein [Clostridia bacterium]
MKKFSLKAISVLLVTAFMLSIGIPAFAVEKDYTIVSPYADVEWGVTNEYKGNLHTHSTYSDANESLVDTILEHYEQGFDFVAMTDHGVTGVAWNKKPYMRLLYSYQPLLGYKRDCFTDDEFVALQNGSFPLKATGEARGRGMVCVTGGNELNALTASKSHVNGIFLPSNFGNTNLGFENGYRYAVNQIDEQGGLSFINHPGDWLDTNEDMNNVYDEDKLNYFTDIFMDYDTCLGMEVFNEKNGTTGYDRILWDNLLMKTLPYGRNIIGFSNNDTHERRTVDSSFSVFLMEENNMDTIKATMQSGSFFMITRILRGNDVIGPAEEFDVMDQQLPYPMFDKLTVDGHKVSVNARETDYIQWIANGKVIAKQDVTSADQEIVLDLDAIEGSEDFLYVRAELFGEGGLCASQALVIDDGEVLEYVKDTSPEALWKRFVYIITSTRLVVYAQEIVKAIEDALE